MSFSFLLFFTVPLAVLVFLSETAAAYGSGGSYLNVYGEALQPCSSDGMALTGYTRTGYCVDRNDDSGSHHICIDLSSLGGGDDDNQMHQNFCDVTGQSDWCSSQDMPCNEDPNKYECPVTDWCVCQWAFASYIERSGGCNNIQTIECSSINQQAVIAYQQQLNSNQQYQDALDCLVERCGLDSSHLSAASMYSKASFISGGFEVGEFESDTLAIVTVLMAVVALVVIYIYRMPEVGSRTIELNKDEDSLGKDTENAYGSTKMVSDKEIL